MSVCQWLVGSQNGESPHWKWWWPLGNVLPNKTRHKTTNLNHKVLICWYFLLIIHFFYTIVCIHIWLVVEPTHLKKYANVKLENFSPIFGVKIKHLRLGTLHMECGMPVGYKVRIPWPWRVMPVTSIAFLVTPEATKVSFIFQHLFFLAFTCGFMLFYFGEDFFCSCCWWLSFNWCKSLNTMQPKYLCFCTTL